MNPQPTVSVVIPFYNHAEYLRDAVESVVAQTYPKVEVIVVDDCSPDARAIELLRGLRHPRLLVFKLENTKGVSVARNAGINRSSGELILPLDADDLIDSTYLEKTVPLMLEDEKLGGVCTTIRVFGKSNTVFTPQLSMMDLLTRGTTCSTILFRRELYESVGGYKEGLQPNEERQFLIDAISKDWQFALVNQPLYFFRRHDQNKPQTCMEDRYSELVANNLELYKKHLPEILDRQRKRVTELADARTKLAASHEKLVSQDKRLQAGLTNVMNYYRTLETEALSSDDIKVGQL
jgi:glycosyltransferase involved in cell wall biosynthesis